jgi:acetyl esterase
MAWTDDTIPLEDGTALPVRVYGSRIPAPGAPLVFHLHGGAFLEGASDSGETVSGLLAEAGAVVVSADYAKLLSRPFPHALETTLGALQWLHKHRTKWVKNSRRVFVAGEDAGGNLAAGLALMARDQKAPDLTGQILLSPMLKPDLATDSARCAEAGPVGCKWADGWHRYLGSADKAAHPYAAPGNATRLAGLPATLVVTAQDDPMRDESLDYARRLREAGVPVQEHTLASPTGWPCALGRCSGAKPAWAATVRETFATFFKDAAAARRPLQN